MDGTIGPVGYQVGRALVFRRETAETGGSRAGPPPRQRTPERRNPNPSRPAMPATTLSNPLAGYFDREVSFSYDARIDQIVVRVIEGSTGDVIRQIPREELIELRLRSREALQGLILHRIV